MPGLLRHRGGARPGQDGGGRKEGGRGDHRLRGCRAAARLAPVGQGLDKRPQGRAWTARPRSARVQRGAPAHRRTTATPPSRCHPAAAHPAAAHPAATHPVVLLPGTRRRSTCRPTPSPASRTTASRCLSASTTSATSCSCRLRRLTQPALPPGLASCRLASAQPPPGLSPNVGSRPLTPPRVALWQLLLPQLQRAKDSRCCIVGSVRRNQNTHAHL